MLALTLWQPWAWAILHLPEDIAKPVENRDWMPPRGVIGTRIALHGGKAWDQAGATSLIQRGYHVATSLAMRQGILGTARLVGVIEEHAYMARLSAPRFRLVAGSWGETSEARCMPWFVGRYGWLFDQRRVFDAPIPCRGLQKLWTVPDDVAARVEG